LSEWTFEQGRTKKRNKRHSHRRGRKGDNEHTRRWRQRNLDSHKLENDWRETKKEQNQRPGRRLAGWSSKDEPASDPVPRLSCPHLARRKARQASDGIWTVTTPSLAGDQRVGRDRLGGPWGGQSTPKGLGGDGGEPVSKRQLEPTVPILHLQVLKLPELQQGFSCRTEEALPTLVRVTSPRDGVALHGSVPEDTVMDRQ
jgi:hypothetical protein